MEDHARAVAAHVDAAAALLEMPLDVERRAAVIAALTRLAEFAADVARVPLSERVEIAGVFVP
jgi:hypothetical protein